MELQVRYKGVNGLPVKKFVTLDAAPGLGVQCQDFRITEDDMSPRFSPLTPDAPKAYSSRMYLYFQRKLKRARDMVVAGEMSQEARHALELTLDLVFENDFKDYGENGQEFIP